MVDKELKFLAKNNIYGIILKSNPFQNIEHNILYSNGEKLKYGDPAEIFSAISENEFNSFMQSAISGFYFIREHYWFTFGYQPSDYDNQEIKENEVRIHYAGEDNTILKKDFYELCLLLCDAKLNSLTTNIEIKRIELLSIISQLEYKIKDV